MTAVRRRRVTGAVRRIGVVLAAVLGLTLLPAAQAGAAPANAWSSPTGGNGNQMHNAGEATITARNAARVTTAWTTINANAGGEQTPTVADGVVYYIHRAVSVTDWNTLVAASARTGQTLWQVQLSLAPNTRLFDGGVTVAGSRVLIPFWAPAEREVGLIAVDRNRRAIAWTRTAPHGGDWSHSDRHVYADGSRAYVHLAGRTLTAYRLSDGRPSWSIPLASNYRVGVALGGGRLYVGYDEVPGITAYDTATGSTLWTAAGQGTPVLAGGRIFSTPTGNSVNAINAAGCGRAACPALWTRTFPVAAHRDLHIGGADGRVLFVSYQTLEPGSRYYTGHLVRLAAGTGATQWSRTLGAYFGPPVRGGNVVWLFNSYVAPDNVTRTRILGFAATGTRTAPLREIAISQSGFPQSLAVGGGTLLHKTHIGGRALNGYRVPGS